MIAALISFFGGSVFRMVWGELSSAWTAHQDHTQEITRLRLQGELDAAQHQRNMESITVQAGLGIKVIEAQSSAALDLAGMEIFGTAVEFTGKPTGLAIVDVWNGVIRPALATECMLLWSLHLYRHGWTLDDQGWALIGAALGIFVADRSLLKRNK